MALDEDRRDSLVSDPDSGAAELSTPRAERTAAPAAMPASPRAQSFQIADHAYPTKRKRPVRRLLFGVLLLGAAAYGGHLGYDWWTDGRFLVSTDDAYVQGDITILAAKMEGYVATVEVVNNQTVRAGDVIARLDDGDYRLALEAAQGKLATQESAVARIGRQIEAAAADGAELFEKMTPRQGGSRRVGGTLPGHEALLLSVGETGLAPGESHES